MLLSKTSQDYNCVMMRVTRRMWRLFERQVLFPKVRSVSQTVNEWTNLYEWTRLLATSAIHTVMQNTAHCTIARPYYCGFWKQGVTGRALTSVWYVPQNSALWFPIKFSWTFNTSEEQCIMHTLSNRHFGCIRTGVCAKCISSSV